MPRRFAVLSLSWVWRARSRRRALELAETTVPPEVVAFWREGAVRLRKTKDFAKKAASWDRAIQLGGSCGSTRAKP